MERVVAELWVPGCVWLLPHIHRDSFLPAMPLSVLFSVQIMSSSAGVAMSQDDAGRSSPNLDSNPGLSGPFDVCSPLRAPQHPGRLPEPPRPTGLALSDADGSSHSCVEQGDLDPLAVGPQGKPNERHGGKILHRGQICA